MSEAIDIERVTAWLVAHTPPVEPPLSFELVTGGRSNLTFLVTDSVGRRLVLRRPPISHVLATAHDMGRTACSRRMCHPSRGWPSCTATTGSTTR